MSPERGQQTLQMAGGTFLPISESSNPLKSDSTEPNAKNSTILANRETFLVADKSEELKKIPFAHVQAKEKSTERIVHETITHKHLNPYKLSKRSKIKHSKHHHRHHHHKRRKANKRNQISGLSTVKKGSKISKVRSTSHKKLNKSEIVKKVDELTQEEKHRKRSELKPARSLSFIIL